MGITEVKYLDKFCDDNNNNRRSSKSAYEHLQLCKQMYVDILAPITARCPASGSSRYETVQSVVPIYGCGYGRP
jgi:hypothetical protein